MHPGDPAADLREGLEIAERLPRLERAEAVARARDDDLVGVVAGDLQEQPSGRSALVELAGGVEIARTVGHRGGHAQPVAQDDAQLLETLPGVLERREV